MPTPKGSIGVWLIGAGGALATTVIVGARAIARGLAARTALVSDAAAFRHLELCDLPQLRFGGHEIRSVSVEESAGEIASENGSLRRSWIDQLRSELVEVSHAIRPGVVAGSGTAIEALAEHGHALAEPTGRACVERLARDIRDFCTRESLQRVIVINVASTEPPPPADPAFTDLDLFEKRLDCEPIATLRPGALYAYAALRAGAAYVNFTASASCLCPAIETLATQLRLPYMGSDGKTGETLVKSALAPMFRARRFDVMSWVGYNVLGNRDGLVLSDGDNKASKTSSKDGVVSSILQQPVRTRVGIDFVESLGDSKVAWDYIHFRGFLGHPMAMQFTWQGCDSILAAPLVLDLARFGELALRRGESGPMQQLCSFFKSPLHCSEHDLFRQMSALDRYATANRAESGVS